jgi:hypothetical protein
MYSITAVLLLYMLVIGGHRLLASRISISLLVVGCLVPPVHCLWATFRKVKIKIKVALFNGCRIVNNVKNAGECRECLGQKLPHSYMIDVITIVSEIVFILLLGASWFHCLQCTMFQPQQARICLSGFVAWAAEMHKYQNHITKISWTWLVMLLEASVVSWPCC